MEKRHQITFVCVCFELIEFFLYIPRLESRKVGCSFASARKPTHTQGSVRARTHKRTHCLSLSLSLSLSFFPSLTQAHTQKSDYFLVISQPVVASKSGRLNPLTPNDHYSGRTAPLTSKRCILYIYSTNIGTNILNMVYTLWFCFFKMHFLS